MCNFYIYKFFDKQEYRDDFLSGMLYSNKLSYYREIENKSIGVKDIFENADIISIADDTHYVNQFLRVIDGKLFVEYKYYDDKPEGYIENQAFISYNQSDYNVFCASTLNVDEQNIVVKFDKRNRKNFGNYGVIVNNTPIFLSRLKNSIKNNKNVNMVFTNFIKYMKYSERENVQRWSPFMKFDFFSEQQEWRIVFDADTKGVFKYNIGDLHDICYIIKDKNEFFDLITVGERFK